MPQWTRRRALLAAASGCAALAGCAGSNEDRVSIPRYVGEESIEEYDVRRVRATGPRPLFRLPYEETATTTARISHHRNWFMTSADEVATLRFDDRNALDRRQGDPRRHVRRRDDGRDSACDQPTGSRKPGYSGDPSPARTRARRRGTTHLAVPEYGQIGPGQLRPRCTPAPGRPRVDRTLRASRLRGGNVRGRAGRCSLT